MRPQKRSGMEATVVPVGGYVYLSELMFYLLLYEFSGVCQVKLTVQKKYYQS